MSWLVTVKKADGTTQRKLFTGDDAMDRARALHTWFLEQSWSRSGSCEPVGR